jgi:hypothetical protein
LNEEKIMKSFITATVLAACALVFGSISPVSGVEPAKMSAKQVMELVANAKTPADHLKLAAWYKAEADKMEAQASDHEGLAAVYRSHPAVLGSKSSVPISGSAMHCSNLAASLRAAAKEDRELATEHELMAKGAKK